MSNTSRPAATDNADLRAYIAETNALPFGEEWCSRNETSYCHYIYSGGTRAKWIAKRVHGQDMAAVVAWCDRLDNQHSLPSVSL